MGESSKLYAVVIFKQVVTRLIHLLGQKILGNMQQVSGPLSGV